MNTCKGGALPVADRNLEAYNLTIAAAAEHRKAMRARAAVVAETLIGSSGTPAKAGATEDEIGDAVFCDELDSLAFECAVCGWWCGSEEETTESVCGDCDRSEEDDDDGWN